MALPGHIDLNDLLVFNAVVEARGFSGAAERLGVAPAKVSLEIARLEKRLGTTLFSRTTRQVALTEAGQALHEQAWPPLQQLLSAVDNLHAATAALSGTLRIAAPVDHGAQSLAPALVRFAARHPALHIDLRASDRVSDLVAEGIDIAIRFGWLRDSSLRAVQLGEFAQYPVASPDYLRQHRPIRRPEDLMRLDWLALTLLPKPLTWTFTSTKGKSTTVQLNSRVKVDSPGTLRAMLRHGGGVSVLDEFSAQEDLRNGTLVRLLPAWRLASGGMFAVYPPGCHISRKAQAFVAFYQEYLRAGHEPVAVCVSGE
ncbi:MAG: LysR family transcriptional regulator [Massilia sp.]